jgi:hypothetical protein
MLPSSSRETNMQKFEPASDYEFLYCMIPVAIFIITLVIGAVLSF